MYIKGALYFFSFVCFASFLFVSAKSLILSNFSFSGFTFHVIFRSGFIHG